MSDRRSRRREGEGPQRATRERFLAHAFYTADGIEGRGVLTDLSVTGARIKKATDRMATGTRITLLIAVREDCFPMEIKAEVVRDTASGFAIEFSDVDSRLKKFLEFVLTQAVDRGEDDEDDTEPEIPPFPDLE